MRLCVGDNSKSDLLLSDLRTLDNVGNYCRKRESSSRLARPESMEEPSSRRGGNHGQSRISRPEFVPRERASSTLAKWLHANSSARSLSLSLTFISQRDCPRTLFGENVRACLRDAYLPIERACSTPRVKDVYV